ADRAWIDRLEAGGDTGQVVAALVAAYFDRTSDAAAPASRPLHDPCVPVLALWPDLFRRQAMRFGIDVSDGPDAGALIPGPHGVKVALGVDAPAVLDRLAVAIR